MALYAYSCNKCSSRVTEIDKIPNEFLDTAVCPFCRAQGTLKYEGTEGSD
jgi:hypothetical protein